MRSLIVFNNVTLDTFSGVPGPLGFTLTASRTFPGGKVLLDYRRAG